MFVFSVMLAAVTAVAIWATERVDRPRRRQAHERLALAAAEPR